jgi:AraC-like DNA-binding protein
MIGLIRLKSKELPHKILTVFWFFILMIIIHFYGHLHDLKYISRATLLFVNISQLFLPVLVFLYVKSIFFKKTLFLKDIIWHIIPTFLYLAFYSIPNLINLFNQPDVFDYTNTIDKYINHAIIKDAYGILYFILSIKLFHKMKNNMKNVYSSVREKEFSWIQKFLFSFFAVIIIDFLLTIIEIYFQYNVSWDAFITVAFLITSVIYLGYYGLSQTTISLPDFLVQKNTKKTILPSEDVVLLESKLNAVVEDEKPYLIPDLTLRLLAEKVGTTERKLSRLLNETMHTSFYDFINKYRVEEAKEKLKSKEIEKFSITGIGVSCGFSSKSSFYRIFKKETGLSPSNYKKTN